MSSGSKRNSATKSEPFGKSIEIIKSKLSYALLTYYVSEIQHFCAKKIY